MKLLSYILGLLALCLQPSCDGDSTPGGDVEPQEEIEPDLFSHLAPYADEAARPLPQGTEVGLYAVPYGQPSTAADTDHANIRCVSDLYGHLNAAGLCKLHEGEDYSFYAYAPRKTEPGGRPEALPFRHGEDVLRCTGNPALQKVGDDNRTLSLTFAHLTAQIRFIVQVSEGSGAGPLQSTSVLRVTGFLPEGRLDLTTGELTAYGEPSEQTDLKAAAVAGKKGDFNLASDPVCFFTTPGEPQTLQVRVTHEGTTRTGDITAVFVPGESSVYTVWIGAQTGLRVTVAVTDWINRYESIDIN